jgi:hypothetical protein
MSEEHHNTVKLDKQSKQFEEYNFFVAQMDLLSKLAYDNDHAIEVILSMISFEECFSCLKVWLSGFFVVRSQRMQNKNRAYPDRLRAKYCDLIENLFVDVGDKIDVMAEVQLSYDWHHVKHSVGCPCCCLFLLTLAEHWCRPRACERTAPFLS